jgi:DNA-directed RNA polymerase beta' subunit
LSPAEVAELNRDLTAKASILVRLAHGICGGNMVTMTIVLRTASEAARSQAFVDKTDEERDEIAKLIRACALDSTERAEELIAQQVEGRDIARAALEGG